MSLPRITSLVLVNLGMIAACKPGEGSPPAEGSAPALSVSAPATAAPTATTTATTTASAGTPVLGKTCADDKDCPGAYCEFAFDGATMSKTGTCTDHRPIYKGRPLVVGGEPKLATAVGTAANHPILVRLRDAALEEHAAIGAFARTICELMALGAPSWLLHATSQAMSDEIRHADDTFAWVERQGGGSLRPGPLPAAVAPLRAEASAPTELYRDVFRGGAVGETLAAARADEESRAATDPAFRAFLGGIAEDEARHAALAFRTLGWLVETFPELGAVRDEEIASFRASASAEARGLVEPLLGVL